MHRLKKPQTRVKKEQKPRRALKVYRRVIWKGTIRIRIRKVCTYFSTAHIYNSFSKCVSKIETPYFLLFLLSFLFFNIDERQKVIILKHVSSRWKLRTSHKYLALFLRMQKVKKKLKKKEEKEKKLMNVENDEDTAKKNGTVSDLWYYTPSTDESICRLSRLFFTKDPLPTWFVSLSNKYLPKKYLTSLPQYKVPSSKKKTWFHDIQFTRTYITYRVFYSSSTSFYPVNLVNPSWIQLYTSSPAFRITVVKCAPTKIFIRNFFKLMQYYEHDSLTGVEIDKKKLKKETSHNFLFVRDLKSSWN